jgi:hypothetical protein
MGGGGGSADRYNELTVEIIKLIEVIGQEKDVLLIQVTA